MNKNITVIIASFILALFSSCVGDDNKKEDSADIYYPVEKVVQAQVDSLKKSPETWIKTVDENGKTETKKIIAKDTEWKTELAILYDLTPNKNAYAGKFKIDSVTKENQTIITYQSTDLKLSMLTIIKNNDGSLKAIYGDLDNSNLFYHSHYEISLVPYTAFAISGRQTLAFFNSQELFSIQWVKEKTDSISTANIN